MSSVQDIINYADLFVVKTAMIKEVRAKDLDFLDADEKNYIRELGKLWDNPGNPPPFIADKDIWKKAKKAVKKYFKKYEEPYAVIVSVYENMGGKFKKKKKKIK